MSEIEMNEMDFQMIDKRNKIITRTPLTPKQRFEILRRDGFTCQYCGKNTTATNLEIDHIIPVSKGGTNTPENLITACIKCNRGKTNSDILDEKRVSIQQNEIPTWEQKKTPIWDQKIIIQLANTDPDLFQFFTPVERIVIETCIDIVSSHNPKAIL